MEALDTTMRRRSPTQTTAVPRKTDLLAVPAEPTWPMIEASIMALKRQGAPHVSNVEKHRIRLRAALAAGAAS